MFLETESCSSLTVAESVACVCVCVCVRVCAGFVSLIYISRLQQLPATAVFSLPTRAAPSTTEAPPPFSNPKPNGTTRYGMPCTCTFVHSCFARSLRCCLLNTAGGRGRGADGRLLPAVGHVRQRRGVPRPRDGGQVHSELEIVVAHE